MTKFERSRCESASLMHYFSELGGLHDARIKNLKWRGKMGELQVTLDDLNSNTFELPSYPGLCPATLVFQGVCNFSHEANLDISETLSWIVDVAVEDSERTPGRWFIELDFNGGEKMSWDFDSLEIRE